MNSGATGQTHPQLFFLRPRRLERSSCASAEESQMLQDNPARSVVTRSWSVKDKGAKKGAKEVRLRTYHRHLACLGGFVAPGRSPSILAFWRASAAGSYDCAGASAFCDEIWYTFRRTRGASVTRSAKIPRPSSRDLSAFVACVEKFFVSASENPFCNTYPLSPRIWFSRMGAAGPRVQRPGRAFQAGGISRAARAKDCHSCSR